MCQNNLLHVNVTKVPEKSVVIEPLNLFVWEKSVFLSLIQNINIVQVPVCDLENDHTDKNTHLLRGDVFTW